MARTRKPKQMKLLRRPPSARAAKAIQFQRPHKASPICMQILHRRRLVAAPDGGPAYYLSLGHEKCTHRGYPYVLNGSFAMVVCVCCLRKMMRRGVSVKIPT